MSDQRDHYYTTEEMYHELVAEGDDVSLEEVQEMFDQLEQAGVVRFVGTTDAGEDMYDIASERKAIAYIARGTAKIKMRNLKRRFLGGGGER